MKTTCLFFVSVYFCDQYYLDKTINYLTLSFLLPNKSENMLVVLDAIPFKSDWILEKKSRPAPANAEWATIDVVLLVDSRLESGRLKESV